MDVVSQPIASWRGVPRESSNSRNRYGAASNKRLIKGAGAPKRQAIASGDGRLVVVTASCGSWSNRSFASSQHSSDNRSFNEGRGRSGPQEEEEVHNTNANGETCCFLELAALDGFDSFRGRLFGRGYSIPIYITFVFASPLLVSIANSLLLYSINN